MVVAAANYERCICRVRFIQEHFYVAYVAASSMSSTNFYVAYVAASSISSTNLYVACVAARLFSMRV